MNKILPFILTTVIGFAVGIYAGMWVKSTKPIPAPPAAVLDELKDAPVGSGNPAAPQPAAAAPDPQREEAFRQIRAEMDAFKAKIDAMKSGLKSQMEPVLTNEQRERMKRWRERPQPPASQTQTPPPGRPRNFWEGFDSAITIVMVPFSLERFDESLKFTPEQRAAVHKILLERRAKFLELVDSTPPPSLKLIKMIPPEARQKAAAQEAPKK